MRSAQHGTAHRRFDAEETGQPAEVYRRRAFLKTHSDARYVSGAGYFVRYRRLEIPLGPT